MILVHILLKNFNANALVVIWKDINTHTMYNQIAILSFFSCFWFFFMVHFKKKATFWLSCFIYYISLFLLYNMHFLKFSKLFRNLFYHLNNIFNIYLCDYIIFFLLKFIEVNAVKFFMNCFSMPNSSLFNDQFSFYDIPEV